MNRKYNLRLDLQFRCNNSVMKFRQSDNKTSDFFMRITSGGELFNIDNAIVILAIIKPDKSSQAQFLEVREGKIYADLNANMKDQIGPYKAQALLIYEDERVSTDVIEYEVTEDNILNQLETTVSTTEEFTMLQQMLSRLSVIENSENLRVENESNRIEAEKLREEAIEKIKLDITELIKDTNLKITNNLKSNSNKVDNLILDSKKEISDYKNAKDTAINDDFVKYKEATNKSIENYKNAKDTEINNSLGEYKTNTTDDIEEFKNTKSQELDDFKNTKNSEIDDYKREKDLAINQYVESKNLEINDYVAAKNRELDEYKGAKDKEIDQYKNTKDKLINDKISEVEAAKQNIVSTANNKVSEMDQAKTNMQNSVNSKIEEADNRISELQNFETQLEQIENKNNQQDNRLKDVEYKNKVQDTYISGLFNENNDKRLSIEGEGNSLKLEGSKEGLVTVDKVVGNTMVNLYENKSKSFHTDYIHSVNEIVDLNRFVEGREYTAIILSSTSNFNAFRISNGDIQYNLVPITAGKIKKFTYIPPTDNINKNDIRCYYYPTDNKFIQGDEQKVKTLILEGDYTNKPIPSEYFEGMQSTFENCKVTQEMVDNGEESVENLGKYKVEVKVRGKNLIDLSKVEQGSVTSTIPYKENNWRDYAKTSLIKVVAGKTYTSNKPYYNGVVVSITDTRVLFYDINKQLITDDRGVKYTFTVPNNVHYIKISHKICDNVTFNPTLLTNWTLEEGTQATPYEPYFSRTQTVYLNSPLLKGDEIVCKEDGLYHYHKMGKLDTLNVRWHSNTSNSNLGLTAYYTMVNSINENSSICNKLANINVSEWTNVSALGIYNSISAIGIIIPTNIVLSDYLSDIVILYELAEPYYEKISDEQIVLEIPNNATLSVESVIPCTSISASYTGGIPSVYGLEETNKNQDDLIDISLMATDEMYMMIEPLLSAVTINERMVSKMVDMYVAMVIRGLKTIEEVPVRYRKEVQAMLDKLEK